jgi:hypothetical protein
MEAIERELRERGREGTRRVRRTVMLGIGRPTRRTGERRDQ